MANLLIFERRHHVDLHYHVLSALDLKADAASVYSGLAADWAGGLLEAYRAAPGRLVVQGLPLFADDLPSMLRLLREGRLADLRDAPGRLLAERLVDALEAEAASHRARWDADAKAALQRQQALEPWLSDLEGLLAALWRTNPDSEHGTVLGTALVDCPSLVTRAGTHGRSMRRGGRLRMALGLGGPLEQVLCQLVHEATHTVTDPPIRAAHRELRQDTRASSPAFALHRELERAAVEEGQRLIDERLPRLGTAYRLWRRRHGC